MSVQFEWQAGSDDGQWETIARAGRGPGRRWLGRVPWWVWVIVGLVIAGGGALGYLGIRRRYKELQRQVEFQIQSVIDLEARAFAQGDADLFLDQQDFESSEWYAQQVQRVRESCSAFLDWGDLFITWYGTAGFRIETGGRVLLIDPYLSRNAEARPVLPFGPEAVTEANEIFVSHGHFDHLADVPQIARQTGAKVYCSAEVARALHRQGVVDEQIIAC